MDSLWVSTAALSLMAICKTLSSHFDTFASKTKNVDVEIQALDVEIGSLTHVLRSLHTSFKGRSPMVELGSQADHEAQYWRNVKLSMKDCEGTLHRMEEILESVEETKRGSFIHQTVKAIKLTASDGEIESLKRELTAYRQTFNFSLQIGTMWEPESKTPNA